MQSSETTDPNAASQEPQNSVPEKTELTGANTLAQLNTLIEESMQIYELEDQKTSIIDDLHKSLQVITEFLSFSVNIHPGIFNLPADSAITLLPNLDIVIKLSTGKTETKHFHDYPPEIITQIIEYVTPQILQLIQTQKSYLTEKITFLRTATKQLSTVAQLKENLPSTVSFEEPQNE